MTLQDELAHASMRSELISFVRRCYMALHNDEQMTENWHIDAICWRLQQAAAGTIRRDIITVPPRHLKTICTSVAFAAWLLGHTPSVRVMVVSHSESLAEKHARDFRLIVESRWFRDLFPACRAKSVTSIEFLTTQRGYRLAKSALGPITGIGADYIIADDLVKADDVNSPAAREQTKRLFDATLIPRLDHPSEGRIIVLQQRLHEDDIVAHLLGKGGYSHLNLPAIADQDEDIAIGDGLVHHRKVGDLLFPQRIPREALDRLRIDMGERPFAAQHLQNPTPSQGALISWEWFKTYAEEDAQHFEYVFQSWDTASSIKSSSDYSVCTTWGARDAKLYLLDIFRARLEFPELKSRAIAMINIWQPKRVLIEYMDNGRGLVQQLQREGLRQVIAFSPKGDKESRFEVQTAKIRDGMILLPEQRPWLQPLRHELTAFPEGTHDDQVDSISQALAWWDHRGHAVLSRGRNEQSRQARRSARPESDSARHPPRRRFPSVDDGHVYSGFGALSGGLI